MIVDASAFIASLAVDGAESALVGGPLLAPDLIVSEVLNVAWKLQRAKAPAPDIDAVMQLLERLVIVPSLPYAKRALQLAERFDHPVYDCLYLSVAEKEGDILLTADRRLIAKLSHTELKKRVTLLSIPS